MASDSEVMIEQLEYLLDHKHGHPGPPFDCPDCIRYEATAKALMSPWREPEKEPEKSNAAAN